MALFTLSPLQLALVLLPFLFNVWCIWHAMTHAFPGDREKYWWTLGCVFLPVAGGLVYVLFGLRRSRPVEAAQPRD